MTRVTALHLAVIGVLLGIVTHLFVQSTLLDRENHERTLEAINRLSQSDTDLRRNLLLVRSGLLLQYDTVNQAVARLHQQLETLRALGAAAPGRDSGALSERLEAIAANVTEEEERVEQFKSDIALLRNSWAYFEQKSRNVSELSEVVPTASKLAAIVSQLLPAMLQVLRQPHGESTELAAARLTGLDGMAVPDALKPHVDSMIMHGRLILRLSPKLDTTLRTLLTSTTPGYVDAFRSAYLDNHRRVVEDAERYRILLYGASLLLLIYLSLLFFRLQAGATALALSNEGLLREIADRKQAEDKARALQAELAHAHRLSLMGEMASGLAHELNQPLTAIRLYAKGCVRRLRSGKGTRDEILAAMDQLSAQVMRAGEIVGWIRSFVKQQKPQTSSVDVNSLIREAVDLLSYERRSQHISIELDLSDQLPRVEVDKIEIQQIILNLTRNSMEAMNGDGLRSAGMTIRTLEGTNGTVEVAVADTGPGMPPELLERAFDSFYTTKPQGMGLGLAICRSMVEAHGGQLWAVSTEGLGTTMHFTLPTAKEERHDGVEFDGLRY